jgi:hypothetical protein
MQRAASRMDIESLHARKNFEYKNDLIRLKFLLRDKPIVVKDLKHVF